MRGNVASMENKELVVPPPRRMAKYTVVKYRDVPTPDGKIYTAKIEVGISCPHDAVLETTVTRLCMSTMLAQPQNAATSLARRGCTANLETAP